MGCEDEVVLGGVTVELLQSNTGTDSIGVKSERCEMGRKKAKRGRRLWSVQERGDGFIYI